MSELPVPQEQGATTIDFRNVTVIGITGSGITSINGDGTPAQILSAGPGITIVDGGGGGHVISVTGGGAIVSINGDTTAAQTLAPAPGSSILVADGGGGAHTIDIQPGDGIEQAGGTLKWKRATGVLITGGFGFTGLGEVFIDAQAPLFLNTLLPPFAGGTGRLGLYSAFGLQTALGGPPLPLVLDGTITFRQFDNGTIVAGANHNVSLVQGSGYNSALIIGNVATPYSITGFDVSTIPVDQRSMLLTYYNQGIGACTFLSENVGSNPNNRIHVRTDPVNQAITIPGNSSISFYYDSLALRWNVFNDAISGGAPPVPTSSAGVAVADDNAFHDVYSLVGGTDLPIGIVHLLATVDFPHQATTGSMQVDVTVAGVRYGLNACLGSNGQAGMTRSCQVSALIPVTVGVSVKVRCMQANSGVATLTTTLDTILSYFRIGNVGQ